MKSIQLFIVAIIFFSCIYIKVLNWIRCFIFCEMLKNFIYQNIRESSVAMLFL